MTNKPDVFAKMIVRSFVAALALILVFFSIFSPNYVSASVIGLPNLEIGTKFSKKTASLPLSEGVRESNRTITVYATSYNSEPGQTDDTPFISANGTYVYDGMIAANFLPFGTLVRFPNYSGDKIYRVDDRMNRRYGHGRIDIWMEHKADSIAFGIQPLEMEIVGRQYTSKH